ncbi:Uma2 family endonuclease [Bergeyella zoohelcum]|uniref:Uma2 family endonuclease n=1 Tax=Bergeyella zoohelcum TaxID=1015 RepID=UPI0037355583
MEITNINQLDLNSTYSYADYLLWKLKERVELFRGKILKMSPAPSRKHQEISFNLTLTIGHLFRNSPCKLYIAPFDVRLPKTPQNRADQEVFTVVQPDLCIVCDENKLDDKGCIGAPDLIIEILSPGNSKKEMKSKFEIYEEAGVREYWIVDPVYESVLINVLENGVYRTFRPIVDNEVKSHIFPNIVLHTQNIFF